MKKILKTTWKLLEKIIMLAILFISITIVTQRVSNNENSFLGFRIFRVETGSMIPKYQIGDVILIKEKDIDQIVVGDDVTYYGTSGTMKGKIVTHQVIEITEEDGQKIFQTKGIANTAKDPVISGDQIDGVVLCKLRIVSALISVLSNGYVFYFCGVIPLTVLIFFTIIKGNIKKYDKMNNSEDEEGKE
ncbi:MAG: signal peptidase I [Clostridia bacterium]|nr:signal peptidase I [Clostridia bacterium]